MENIILFSLFLILNWHNFKFYLLKTHNFTRPQVKTTITFG